MDNLFAIYMSQLIAGIAQTTCALASQKFISVKSIGVNREKSISIFSMGVAGGGLIGPLFGGWLSDVFNYQIAIALLSLAIIISLFIISYLLLQEYKENTKGSTIEIYPTNKSTKENKNILHLLRNVNIRKAMLISMLVLLARDFYLYYFPLLADGFGYSATMIGIIIAFHNGASIIIRWALIDIIERWGKSEVIVTSVIISGLLFGLLPFSDILIIIIIISTLLGALLGIGQPLSITTTVHFSPKDRIGEILGLRLTFNRFTQFASPIIFGGIASLYSLSIVFWVVAVTLGIGSTKIFINEESKKENKKKSPHSH